MFCTCELEDLFRDSSLFIFDYYMQKQSKNMQKEVLTFMAKYDILFQGRNNFVIIRVRFEINKLK